MPDYKRKKRSRFSAKPKTDKTRYKEKEEKKNIIDIEDEKPKKKSSFNILKGKKAALKRRWKKITIALIAIISALIICEAALPAGLYETVLTMLRASGSGSYPISLETANTENVVVKSNFYYVLTNSEVKAVSNGGKVIFTYTHGFENPVIKTSSTRALVFNQGGNNAIIFNLDEVCSTIETEKEIKTAAIGEDGTYVIVTDADGYVAAVNVYEKDDTLLYQWFSSNDMVNNVALSENGEKLAVSTLTTNVGGFNSKLMILNYESANPEFTREYNGEIIYNLSTAYSDGLAVATANNFDFINWSEYELKQYKNEYNLQMMRECNDGIVLVYNRENDKTDNRVVIVSDEGEVTNRFEFGGIITDIALEDDVVYCVSDTKAYILDGKGKIVRNTECGFGVVRFAVISQDEIAVITDTNINKVKFE